MRLPVDAVRGSDITELMRKNMETVKGVSYIQVHPTFLYESLWCLMVLIIMLIYRKHKKFNGELFLVYLFGYGFGTILDRGTQDKPAADSEDWASGIPDTGGSAGGGIAGAYYL